MHTSTKFLIPLATASLLLSACGSSTANTSSSPSASSSVSSSTTSFKNPDEAYSKLQQAFHCASSKSGEFDKSDDLGRYDGTKTVTYSWLDCEISNSDSAPYAGASFTIRVADQDKVNLDDLYANTDLKDPNGTYYVLDGDNWVLLPSNNGEEWKTWVERAQKTMGGTIVTYKNYH